MEFYTRYKFTKNDYATPALLWPEGHLRKDRKHNFYAVISKNFWKRYFASLSYNWIKNRSNTELYEFDKNIFGFSMGFKF